MSARSGPGLALETATEVVSVAVVGADGAPLAHRREDVGHGHTRRVAAMAADALAEAGVGARDLSWVAADLGPGSFTAVRVGLASASALALVSGARRLGASSLAALAHAAPVPAKSLLVPLVGAGRRDLYAGFFRTDTRRQVRLVAAPRVDTPQALLAALAELVPLLPGHTVRFVGPGAGREQALLEQAHPGSTATAFRHDGLDALDLARAAVLGGGPGEGLPMPGLEGEPAYVRPAQAEETVRRRVVRLTPTALRDMTPSDLAAVHAVEQRLFGDAWTMEQFLDALETPGGSNRVAERGGELAGYLVATFDDRRAELHSIAVSPEHQRCGVGVALMDDLIATCRVRGVPRIELEVRVSNAAAQALYRQYGFRLEGLRRQYYLRPREDALLMGRTV